MGGTVITDRPKSFKGNNKMKLYDLHIHTFLSDCASKTNAHPADYVKAAVQGGLAAIGFSDHAWDESIEGASGWYAKQPFCRLEARKELLSEVMAENPGIKILFGAEAEYAKGILAFGQEAAARLDYVIVPHSHTHMRGFVLPEGYDSPEKHAQYLVKSFYELCTHKKRDLFFGIAHPMFPVGQKEVDIERIFEHITDADMNEGLCAAAENGIFLELNMSSAGTLTYDTIQNSFFARFYHNAKKAGCNFFIGSDKHQVIPFGEPDRFFGINEYMEKLGLDEGDFTAALDKIFIL
jgi:histidinol phosphatase-like PHP family hydrolase